MNLKVIPEKLFVRRINTETIGYTPASGSTYYVEFILKKKRRRIKDYKKQSYDILSDDKLLPEEEIRNLPASGFVVIWPDKVQDPRGFVVWVSNLDEVVSNTAINRGVIEEDLWYAVDSNNHLTLLSSEIEKTVKKTLPSIADVKVGDIIEGYESHEIYLGKFKTRHLRGRNNLVELETSRVLYNVEEDYFNTSCYCLGAGSIISGMADPDDVLEITDRFKSYLKAYTDLDDKIDKIFVPKDRTREYPSDMFDRLYSADKMRFYSYPFYKIIESREIACLRLTPACSYAERIKDGIKYEVSIERLNNDGRFSTNYGDYVTWNNITEEISNFSGSWKELLKVQGWIFYGGEDPSRYCYNNPKLFVKMKSGITLIV